MELPSPRTFEEHDQQSALVGLVDHLVKALEDTRAK